MIEDIYYGTLCPAEKIIPQDPNYGPLWDKIKQETQYLAAKLPGEDRARLEGLDALYSETACMYAYASFACGLRPAAGDGPEPGDPHAVCRF